MSLSLQQLKHARPAILREVAATLVMDRELLEQVLGQLIASRVVVKRWTGHAAEAAVGEGERLIRVIRSVCAALSATDAALLRAAEALEAARALVRRAETVTAEAGGGIDDRGRVVLPTRLGQLGDPVTAAGAEREAERIRWQARQLLDRALASADMADGELARALTAAVVDNACFDQLDGGGRLAPPVPATTPSTRSSTPSGPSARYHPVSLDRDRAESRPFANSAWWQALSESQRDWVVRMRPEWVGPLDGVPAAARHRANLVLLARAERAAQAQLDEVVSGPALRGDALLGVGFEGQSVGLRERQRVDDLRAVREVVDREDGVSRQLLQLDASGALVTAAVAVGDVDTAAHVATFVGGLSTTVRGDLRRYDAAFAAKRQKAVAMGGGAEVAIVTWLAYPAPQAAEVLAPGGRSVLSDRVAKDNAAALAAFLNGIDASRKVLPHQTLWAHSYGSVVGGYALRRNTGVDDVVLFGSPGVAFTSLSEAGLKPGSLNVLRADRDLVAYSGWHLKDPAHISGVSLLSTGWSKSLGLNPGLPSTGHSEYLVPGTTSEHNLLAVVVGRPDLRIPSP